MRQSPRNRPRLEFPSVPAAALLDTTPGALSADFPARTGIPSRQTRRRPCPRATTLSRSLRRRKQSTMTTPRRIRRFRGSGFRLRRAGGAGLLGLEGERGAFQGGAASGVGIMPGRGRTGQGGSALRCHEAEGLDAAFQVGMQITRGNRIREALGGRC